MFDIIIGYISENPVDNTIYTNGVNTYPNEYSWLDLISTNNFKKMEYKNIYILEDKFFKTKGNKFLPKRVNRFLSRVVDNGTIFIKEDVLCEFSIPKMYKYSDTLSIKIDENEYEFNKYIKKSSIENNSKDIFITKKIKRKKERPKFEIIEDLLSLEGYEHECMTFDSFKKCLNSDDFVSNFHFNLIKLFDEKIKKYSNLLDEIKIDQMKNKIKIEQIKEYINEEKKINDIFTEHIQNSLVLVHINSIISQLDNLRKNFGVEQLRNTLLYSFLDSEEGLESLIGMDDMKNMLCELFYGFSRNYKIFTSSFINFCITGNPGSGKTYLSERIGTLFTMNKIFVSGIKKVSRADLVGMYVGHTSKEVKNLLFNNIEGVVIIDEAYSLVPKSDKDFSSESITEIVNFMDKYLCCQCLIFLGYHDLMTKNFLTYNKGMKRRIPYLYQCFDYTPEDLAYLLVINLEKKIDEELSLEIQNIIYTYVFRNKNIFTNQMGDILNLSNIILTKFLIYGINKESLILAFKTFEKNDNF